MEKQRAAICVLTALAVVAFFEKEVEAGSPDPVIASMLSVGSTAIPIGITAALWGTGRGPDEGLRFDLGLAMLALGTIAGPSVGQIYGEGGVDAVITFVLRAITGAVMTAGVGLRVRGADNVRTTGLALAILGGIPAGLLAIYDIFGAASSATQARYREGHGSRILVTPELYSIAVCGPIPCGAR